MKYIVLLCDGMADHSVKELNGKTPMEAAEKPNMDKLAGKSVQGLCKTVADDLKPGSDVANLSVLGYDPKKYYSGRSPLEAGSIGIDMKPTDVSFRCNLVTLSDETEYSDKTMVDYCAGDISSAEAHVLIKHVNEHLGIRPFSFYGGVSYRHCLIWDNGTIDVGELTPPHDITGEKISGHLNVNQNGKKLLEMMEKSYDLLKNHPINYERIKNGRRPANSIWLWGEGTKKILPSFKEKYGLLASMISAVDLLKGIGKFTGMNVIDVPGATGYLDTDFSGKANAAVKALKSGSDFVYIHIEAPDECGHRGEVQNKIKSLEYIDKLVLAPILKAFSKVDFKILICPDHPTPLDIRTHTNEPVPFLIYDSRACVNGFSEFSEKTAKSSGVFYSSGESLMEYFLR
ncbi:MAG: cofactor-independent phosphoglycerate mutase [Eubacterium sp.]|jgi:2,3-bisphosphoglycerate-independent phosphoglycerate mutase|nr:cofactor-independent phosphoglycerate mutase [Eubacterium sp.]